MKSLLTSFKSNKSKFLFAVFGLGAAFSLNSCVIGRKMVGADFNQEEFSKYREAKISELRYQKAKELDAKINSTSPVKPEIQLSLNKAMLEKIGRQYVNSTGWIDNATSYVIKNMKTELNYGSALMTFSILAHNNNYNVDVDLLMDCVIGFEFKNEDLILQLEPFNITPIAKAGGLLSATEDLIERMVQKNLASMSTSYPPFKFPLNIKKEYVLQSTKMKVRDKINMDIESPEKKVDYTINVADISIFEDAVQVGLNIAKVEVRK